MSEDIDYTEGCHHNGGIYAANGQLQAWSGCLLDAHQETCKGKKCDDYVERPGLEAERAGMEDAKGATGAD